MGLHTLRLHENSIPTRILTAIIATALLANATGCALIGNVKPLEEKSDSYGVSDLSKETPDWVRLDKASRGLSPENQNDPDATATEASDVAFQSKKDASIISLNSACHQDTLGRSLRKDSEVLFFGISDITFRQEKPTMIQGTPALQTIVQGKLNGEPISLEAVVLRRATCLYDLLYVSRPEHFASNEKEFSHFVASLRLK